MMRWLLVGLLALAFCAPHSVRAQGEATLPLRVSAPVSGDVLRGVVNITGTNAVDGFFTSELSFAYASDSTSSWFLIANLDQPTSDGLLAAWDTNLVTDGDYDLRLRVTLQDGTILETLVTGLHIRNLTPTETPTLAPTATPEFVEITSTPLPTDIPIPTATRRPTPTPLPSNPAAVTQAEIYSFLGRGILLALLSFLLVGLFLRLRRS
jgi:hypothetical protein